MGNRCITLLAFGTKETALPVAGKASGLDGCLLVCRYALEAVSDGEVPLD